MRRPGPTEINSPSPSESPYRSRLVSQRLVQNCSHYRDEKTITAGVSLTEGERAGYQEHRNFQRRNVPDDRGISDEEDLWWEERLAYYSFYEGTASVSDS